MAYNLNRNSLRDRSKAANFIRDLLFYGVNVPAIQETLFVCDVNTRVLSSDFVVYSTYSDWLVRRVSLLVKRFLNSSVSYVHVDARVKPLVVATLP